MLDRFKCGAEFRLNQVSGSAISVTWDNRKYAYPYSTHSRLYNHIKDRARLMVQQSCADGVFVTQRGHLKFSVE